MTTTTVTTIISGLLTEIGVILAAVLPSIIGFIALMTVLWFGVRFILGKLRSAN